MTEATPACPACGSPIIRRSRTGPKPKHCLDAECRKGRARVRALAWYRERRDDPEFQDKRRFQTAAAGKRWREANREHVRAKLAEWRSGNREALAEQYRKWRLANADRVTEKNRRRRARLLDALVEAVDPDLIWQRDEGVCQLCGDPIDSALPWPDPFSRTLDHVVPLAKGGTHEPANVQLAHAVCNSIKGDRIVA